MSEATPITGYRQLSEAEIDLMNKVKAHAEATHALIKEVHSLNSLRFGGIADHPPTVADAEKTGESSRWCALAKSQLQQGYMALNRAIALPTTF